MVEFLDLDEQSVEQYKGLKMAKLTGFRLSTITQDIHSLLPLKVSFRWRCGG